MLQSDLTPLFSWRRSHISLSFSSFLSLATNPAGLIQRACLFAGIFSIIPAFISFLTSFLTLSAQWSSVFLGFLVKKGFTPVWSSTSMGGQVMFCACSNSSTRTSSNSLHRSLNSCGHSRQGHAGDCGSGFCSQGLSLFGVICTSDSVA